MKVQKIEQSFKRNIVLLLVMGIVVSLLLGGLVYRNDINNRLDSVSIEQQRKIAQAQVLWGQKIGDISHTIQLLYRSPALNYALSTERDVNTDLLQRLFSSFVESVDTLMQVRWLDAKGKEVVRVDVLDGKPVVVDSNKLQDKSDRYYVEQGMGVKDGEIFLSNIDLNVENGKIEVPYKPTIRVTIKTGSLTHLNPGLLVLNYDVGEFLNTVKNFDSDSVNLLMLDKDGYWIMHTNPEFEWGNDLNRSSNNASTQNLDVWSKMVEHDSQGLFYSSLGLISFQCNNHTNNAISSAITRAPSLCYVAKTSDDVLHKLRVSALLPAIFLGGIVILFGLIILKREWHLRVRLIQLYRDQERDKQIIEESVEYTRDLLKQQQLLQHDLIESSKLSALGMMVAGVAHELNTPIGSAIMATSKLSTDHKQLSEAVRSGLTKSALQKYLDNSETGLTLISESQKRAVELIRSFKRLAIDRSREEVVNFELSQVVNDLLVTLTPRFKSSNIKYEIDVDIIEMTGRPGVVSQVIQNLLMNAIHHAFKGSLSGKLILTGRLLGGQNEVEIKVADNGVGIAAEVLPNIFDPFVTTNRVEGNTGLGMHFVHQWVTKSLLGSIKIETESNKGTSIIIKLPRRLLQDDE